MKLQAMKGLFISFEFDINNANVEYEGNGIIKKIIRQISFFESHNCSIEFWNPYSGRKHSVRRITRRLPFYFLNNWYFNYQNARKFDFIYIRKAWFMDGDIIRFLKKIKMISPNTKIILEVPTYPYDGEAKKINMIPLILKDKIWRKKLHNYVDRIVTFSKDCSIFNIKTICIPNGIDIKSISQRDVKIINKKEIHLIACSSLYYWHGYDRVIKGMNTYYTTKKDYEPEVFFHIVGNGDEKENYKRLISELNLEKYIILYGQLSGEKLDQVYNKVDIGLDSMGRHRSGVFFNSSLKGKEYCAKGLPIVSGVETELDFIKDYPYYMRVPANDNDVEIRTIINFFHEIFEMEEKDNETVSNYIRKYAANNFDYSVAMGKIIDYINTK